MTSESQVVYLHTARSLSDFHSSAEDLCHQFFFKLCITKNVMFFTISLKNKFMQIFGYNFVLYKVINKTILVTAN